MRVLMAMREGERRDKFRLLMESERSDCSVFCSDDGQHALEDIAALVPDVLVVDQVLPRMDGQALLTALEGAWLPCPPKVVFCLSYGQEETKLAGADMVLPAAGDFQLLLSAIQEAEKLLQGFMARKASPTRRQLIQMHLKELGMPEGIKGHSYLTYLLDLAIPAPSLLDALTARLYPAAAVCFSTTPAAVERCIRHAIEATWSRGDMAALERLFGLSIDPDRGKPTNREFLAMSAQHLRQQLLQFICDDGKSESEKFPY